ncbi:MAG: hypothetical protein ACI4KI_01710 [Candidatus Fimenecus sp.]
MAQYNKYTSYDFERFEPKTVSRGTAAPKINAPAQKKPQLELVKKNKPSQKQLRAQSIAAGRKTAKIFAVAVAALLFFAAVIYSRVQLDEINRDISRVENSIKTAQSDTVKLNNELNSIVSINKVEDYAVNNLGMVKVQDYQVVYVDLSDSDEVVMANGKSIEDSKVIKDAKS